MKRYLVTGVAGFIGADVALKLLKRKHLVVGIDNMNDYYDVALKRHRLKALKTYKNFRYIKCDVQNRKALKELFQKHKFSAVINLAARAGVRYSMENPHIYSLTNVMGNLNLLDLCKDYKVKKYIMASTSSLYAGQKMPFKEDLPVNTPISPYAASKKGAEVAAYTYHYLYGLDVSVLRYFTVYGPACRPDMSILGFIKRVDEGVTLPVYGDGNQTRDFTYIDDITDGTLKALRKVGFEIINLGGGKRPHKLNTLISLIEKNLGKKAKIKRLPFHKTDMKSTWANISKARRLLGWKPKTELAEGIAKTVAWYDANRSWLKNLTL